MGNDDDEKQRFARDLINPNNPRAIRTYSRIKRQGLSDVAAFSWWGILFCLMVVSAGFNLPASGTVLCSIGALIVSFFLIVGVDAIVDVRYKTRREKLIRQKELLVIPDILVKCLKDAIASVQKENEQFKEILLDTSSEACLEFLQKQGPLVWHIMVTFAPLYDSPLTLPNDQIRLRKAICRELEPIAKEYCKEKAGIEEREAHHQRIISLCGPEEDSGGETENK